jgi:PIN domain nuclease of toxin-antitoxin system
MILLDTHAWIWWNSDPRLPSRRARKAIDVADAVAIAAMSVRLEVHGDPADRLILASAKVHGIALVTKDRRLRSASEVATIW